METDSPGTTNNREKVLISLFKEYIHIHFNTHIYTYTYIYIHVHMFIHKIYILYICTYINFTYLEYAIW